MNEALRGCGLEDLRDMKIYNAPSVSQFCLQCNVKLGWRNLDANPAPKQGWRVDFAS